MDIIEILREVFADFIFLALKIWCNIRKNKISTSSESLLSLTKTIQLFMFSTFKIGIILKLTIERTHW